MLEDDTDSDGDTVAVTTAAPTAEHGTVRCTGDGACRYTPKPGYSGRDSFAYSITDGYGGSSTAVVAVNIQLACTPVTNTLANGNPATTDGAVSITVDGLGAFGSGIGLGDATFNPPGPVAAARTVFSSHLYSSASDTLLRDDCADAIQTEEISRTATSLVTRKTLGTIQIDLKQELGPITATSSALAQTYTLTNTGMSALPFVLVRHLDGDLLFDGTFSDGGAASADGRLLFEYDASDNPEDPSTFVGISGALDENETPDRWTLQPFNYRDDIVDANGIRPEHHGVVFNDTNGDRIVDTPYDVTVSQQWNVVSLAPESSVTFVTTTQFGQQPPANEPPSATADSIANDEDTPGSVDVLANDSDPDDDPVSLVSETDGANGTVSCDGGLCTYTPDLDFNGTDSFTYTITDGRGANSTGTVNVTVAPVNDAPVLDDSGAPTLTSIAEDSGVSGGDTVAAILATGAGGDPITDVDGEGFEGIAVTGTDSENGTWEYSTSGGEGWSLVGGSDTEARLLSPAALLRFVPAADFNGSATLEFRAWDETSGLDGDTADTTENGGTTALSTAKETASITVTAVNDAPTAVDDTKTTAEDAQLVFPTSDLVANDAEGPSNESGQTLAVTAVSDPTGGTVAIDGDNIVFTPTPDSVGAAGFTYTVTDDGTTDGAADPQTDTGSVTVNISEVNDVPTAVGDSKTTAEDIPLPFQAADLLANDVDGPSNESGQSLTVISVQTAVSGTVALDDGQITFTPASNHNGSASFQYTIRDDGTTNGAADPKQATGTVNVTVTAVNDAPVANADGYSTDEDMTLEVTAPGLLANDTDVDTAAGDLSAAELTDPANGSVSVNPDGSFAYNPDPGFDGQDSFTYEANDGALDSQSAMVTIEVGAVNDPPVANDDAYEVHEDATLGVEAPGVLENDTDVDSEVLTAAKVDDPTHGELTLNANGSFTYTPDENFNGADSFTYEANDGELDSDTATVTITVNAVNDAPVLDASGAPILSEIPEDTASPGGNTVAEILATGVAGNPITDVDANALEGSAITATDAANGIWQYSVDGGGSWSNVGTSEEEARALIATARLRFVPNANFNGTATVTFRAWDQTSGVNGGIVDTTTNGGTTAFSTAKEDASITVTPVSEAQQTLTVTRLGNARITSSPAGIDCGNVCTAVFELGTVVTLTATPDSGWTFSGWGGACGGSATCVVTVDGGKAVTASFEPPPPTPAQNVNAAPVAGIVLVKLPGTNQFVPLSAATQLPLGTQIDATHGRVELTAARGGGITDTSQFYEGVFEITQQGPNAITELRLVLGDFSVCALPSFATAAKNRRPVRRVWGSGRGKFRTRGRYSSATVRGTIWKTEDRCDGTLTQVTEGSVTVRDFGRQRDFVVRAGASYLAEPLPRGVAGAGCTIIGTPRRDVLRGTNRRDVICGLGGNDVLSGLGGNDKLLGGAGNDRLMGGRGNDVLDGENGNDWLDGGPGADAVRGGPGVDLMVSRNGDRGRDRVQGGPGRDRCRTDAVRACP